MSFHEGVLDADEAVRTGWRSLRDVFRLWNIFDRGDLTVWLQGQAIGFVCSARQWRQLKIQSHGNVRLVFLRILYLHGVFF